MGGAAGAAVVSYFNAGVLAVDIRDPFAPKEVGFYIPEVTENTDPRCITVNGAGIWDLVDKMH